jgi:hypothetical protein
MPKPKITDADQAAEHREILREFTKLIGNIQSVKQIAGRRPPDKHSIAAQNLVVDMVNELRRLREKLEKKLRDYPWPEDQRELANAQIAIVKLAEAEADGSAPAIFS